MLLPIVVVEDCTEKSEIESFLKEIASQEGVNIVEIVKSDYGVINSEGKMCVPRDPYDRYSLENPAIYLYCGSIELDGAIKVKNLADLNRVKEELIRRVRIAKVYRRLPRIDCKKCGRMSCYDFALNVVSGKASIKDCVVLASPKKIYVKVNGEPILLNPWLSDLYRKVILALITSLKGVNIEGDEKIYIEVRK